MKSTHLDWRYIAGFFDGEGSAPTNKSGYRISIPQTHLGVLNAIRRTTGFGNVVHVTKRKLHWKESWTYTISRQQDVYEFLRQVAPYLIVKQHLVQNILLKMPPIIKRQKHNRLIAKTRKREVKRLRKLGLSYRAIGIKVGLDFGYVRRVFLRGQQVH